MPPMSQWVTTDATRAEGPHVGTDPVSVRAPRQFDFTDRITYFPLSFGCGQTRGLSLHAGILPEWETLLNRTHIIL